MDAEFMPGVDPQDIKHFLHGLGLITLDEYYIQIKDLLKRQRSSSSSMTNEQIQKKFAENGIRKDDMSKTAQLLCPRKRTSFSPVITRKRGKAIKKRTPSATQVVTTTIINTTTTTTTVTCTVSSTEEASPETDTVDYDQPLDLRLRPNSTSKL